LHVVAAGLGGGPSAVELDLRVVDEVEELIGSLERVDVLVNAAGIIRRGDEHRPEVFREVVEINLTGALRAAEAAHDLLAVRGGLGEQTDCPASRTGRLLQRWILLGLRNADAVPCVSSFTREDAQRLALARAGRPALPVVLNGLNYPFRRLAADEADRRLAPWAAQLGARPFVLHVGSAHLRKNREGVLRTFAIHARAHPDALLVLAGQPLPPAHRDLAAELGIADRVVALVRPPDEVVEALYNRAFALLFPSRHEGFGWPVVEAQACGCPVVCSDIPPTREVAGDTALMRVAEDAEGLADCLRSLGEPAQRRQVVEAGLANAERFSAQAMAAQYVAVYRSLLRADEPLGVPA
jgi:glycosyltransferase involved in cell wall biosynthesis